MLDSLHPANRYVEALAEMVGDFRRALDRHPAYLEREVTNRIVENFATATLAAIASGDAIGGPRLVGMLDLYAEAGRDRQLDRDRRIIADYESGLLRYPAEGVVTEAVGE